MTHIKKLLLAIATTLALGTTTPVFADETDKVVNATGNMVLDTMNKTGFFQWISGGIGYSDKTLNWDITAFSNLSETKDAITYVQTSYNRQKSVNRLNLGLGYRKLINTTTTPLIVGVNAFFDTKDGTKNILALKASENFQRYSIGAELKTAQFDMSANLYRPIGNNIVADKKVLRGWDITAKGNIPNYEQVSVGVSTYKFDGVEDTVVKGNKLLAEFRPNPVITIRGEYDKPNGESAKTDISVDFKLAFDKPIQDQMKFTPVPSADTVWHKRYDKVERQYDIKTAEVSMSISDTLTMRNLVVPYTSGTQTVSTAHILGALTVSGEQTQASEWTVKSLSDTDSHTNLAVASGGKTLTISGAITANTTVTVNLAHPEHEDAIKTFELSTVATGGLHSGTHTGSGKWGQTYTTDYKLKTSDTVGGTAVSFDKSADFTFSIVAPAMSVAGFTSTTAGIVSGALTGAIDSTTGAIDGTKLTKGGTLLVKIERVAKGGFPTLSAYHNFTISSQDYPLVFRPSYLTPKAALDAEEIQLSGKTSIIDLSVKNYGVTTPLTSAQMNLIRSQGLVTITFQHDISDVTAIDSSASRAILDNPTADEDVIGWVNSTTFIGGGSEKELATEIKHNLQIAQRVGAFKLQGPAKKVVKFKFQIAADKDKKYNAFEKMIYWVTDDEPTPSTGFSKLKN